MLSRVTRTLAGLVAVPLCAGALVSATGSAAHRPAQPASSRVLSPGALTAVATTTSGGRWTGSVDTSTLSAVNSSYWRSYASTLGVPIGWTGSNSSCTPGGTSSTSRAATLRAINYVRSLAGLAPVTFSTTLNYRAQRGALMMSANRTLSHDPTTAWRCYSSTGDQAAHVSNLALGYPNITSGGLVDMYMDDLGSENRAVGHRRWLLNPFSTTMGTGSTSTANALTVIGPTSSTRPNPQWVSWPAAGYFPNTMEPAGRWSLSAGNASMRFGVAAVRVYRGTTPVPVTKFAPVNGYARPTLVWQMPSTLDKTATYKVVVTNIHKVGTTKTFSHTWYVRLFQPVN